MVKRKRKKRRLKYKNIFLFILLIIIIIAVPIYLITNKKEQKDFSKKITKEEIKEPKKETPQENLHRVTYKDNFYYEDIGEDIKEKITGCSFPKEFNEEYTSIKYEDLKYVKVKHYDYNNNIQDGEMIINSKVAQDVVEIFYKLYEQKYPIEKMKLVEEYNCEDELSMEDNNTSAFNYRIVEETPKLSWHAFGLAIDINPLYNPYIFGNEILPKTATKYTDRSLNVKGLITHSDLTYEIFTSYGWSWGGDFQNTKDYQHYYKTEILDDSIRQRKEQ